MWLSWNNYHITAEKNNTITPWGSQEVFHALKDFIEEPNKYLNQPHNKFFSKEMKMIELGSVASLTSMWLADKVHEVTSIDIAPSAIKRVKNLDKKIIIAMASCRYIRFI